VLGKTDYELVRRMARERSGIVLSDADARTVEARLSALARAKGFASLELLVSHLRARPDEELEAQLVDAVVAHAAPFMLDSKPFEALTNVVLPRLIERRRAHRSLRIWCPACSAGQEPYSVAMAIRERFPELGDWRIEILASDPSLSQIEKASSGTYSHMEAMRGLPTALLLKYFTNDAAGWRVKDDIRSMVRFSVLNLMRDWPAIERMDVIFIRNVLVYFGANARRELLAKVRGALAEDGFLFGGSVDAGALLDQRFQRLQDENTGFYQTLPA
jgi:chemotaxis protein methyltransferase CheR